MDSREGGVGGCPGTRGEAAGAGEGAPGEMAGLGGSRDGLGKLGGLEGEWICRGGCGRRGRGV